MTVNDYILQKFQTFGVNLSEADLFDICLNAKISGGGEMNEDCQTRVSVAIAKFIPSLLLRATSISAGPPHPANRRCAQRKRFFYVLEHSRH